MAPPSLGKGPPRPWNGASDSAPGMGAVPQPRVPHSQRGLSAPSPIFGNGSRLPTPAWEGISPPSRRRWVSAFRLSGNGAVEDYRVQLWRGKTGAAAASIPPPSSSPCLIPLLLPSNSCPSVPSSSIPPPGTRQPPIGRPRALPGVPQRGEGGRVTQGDADSQFQPLAPATGTGCQHTCGVKARLIITTPLQTSRHRRVGRNPHPGSPARARGIKVFRSDLSGSIVSAYFGLRSLPGSNQRRGHAFTPSQPLSLPPPPTAAPAAGQRGDQLRSIPLRSTARAPGPAAFHPFAARIPLPQGLSRLRAQHHRGKGFWRCLTSLWQRT